MKLSKTLTSDTEVVLTISAAVEELASLKQATLKKLAPNVKVAGFRAGKVPANLAEKNFDPQAFQSEFLDKALNKFYNTALEKENLRPVANPEVSIKKFVPFTTLEFTAKVSVIGKVKLTDYKKIKMAKDKVTLGEKEVTDVVASLQERMAERKAVDRAAKDGDEAIIDFKGTDAKGEPVNGAEGKAYPLILGSKAFIPGFEANVVGMKTGESKTFVLTFPKDYGVKALQNRKVTFAVTLTALNEMVKPKADDAFAAKAGPFKTLAELKADIKKQLTFEREQQANKAFEEKLLQAIAAKSTVGVPQSLVDEQVERIETEEKQNLVYKGQTWEEHLKQEGVSAEEHKKQKRPAAEERVKIGIILSEISEMEKIIVTPEEFEVRMQLMKGQYRDAVAQAELDKPEVQRDILARMITEKTISKLVGYAQPS